MSKMLIVISCAVLLLLGSIGAHGHLRNDNPLLRFSFLGNHAIAAPAGTLVQSFKVRVTDVHGNPIPGLTIWFFPDRVVSVNPIPPQNAGVFVGAYAPDMSIALTDANGIATSNSFRVLGRAEQMVAMFVGLASEYNRQWSGGGMSARANFHVNAPAMQEPPEAPWPPEAPGGLGIDATPLPVTSWLGSGVLLLLVLALAATRLRAYR